MKRTIHKIETTRWSLLIKDVMLKLMVLVLTDINFIRTGTTKRVMLIIMPCHCKNG